MLFKAMVPVGGLQPVRRLGFGPRLVYLVGGSGAAGQGVLSTMRAYDPLLDSWYELSSMATKRCVHGAVALGGKLYVMGGADETCEAFAAAEVYDPKADSWQPLPSMPTPRKLLAAAAVAGKVYAIGGNDSTGHCDAVEAYDPISGAWTRVASLPVALSSHTAAVVDGKIYVLGGERRELDDDEDDDVRKLSDRVYVYDPAADSWQQMATMLTPRYVLSAAVLDGKIYVTGGRRYGEDDDPSDVLEAYEPVTNTWTTLATLSQPRVDHASAVINGKLYVFGGWMRARQMNLVEVYSPASNSWARVADLPTAIDEAVAVAI